MKSLANIARLTCGAVALLLIPLTPVHAQDTLNDLKGKLFDARMAQKTFVNGLRFCNELDGTNFYYELRRRVLNLEDYHQSLENLVKAQTFNPDKRRPWSSADAEERWEQVKKEAARDKETCKLVATLPELEKRVQELEAKTQGAQKKN